MSNYQVSKFARRVGYGLRPNENITDDPINWATEQLTSIPQMGIFQPNGNNLLETDYFKRTDNRPITNVAEAVELWGRLHNRWLEINELADQMKPNEWQQLMYNDVYYRRADVVQWRDCLLRSSTATHGTSPVFERFWSFWVNHFAVNASHFTKLFYLPHTHSIRNSMTGQFSDLAIEAILNPAMLFYLDNLYSTGPNSYMIKNVVDSGAAINENLAREVLELHTVGTVANFTQDDVTEMSYALTGWGILAGKKDEPEKLDIPGQSFGTYFDPRRHEPGSRSILGINIPEVELGMQQAPLAIEALSKRKETIERLSEKLAIHFIDDNPPKEAVEAIIDVWSKTDGHLPSIHQAVIEQTYKHITNTQKFQTPEAWLFQLHRTTGTAIPSGPLESNHIALICAELGQPYDEVPQPDGWSSIEQDWVSSALIERRFRFAQYFSKHCDLEKADYAELMNRDVKGNQKLTNEVKTLIDGFSSGKKYPSRIENFRYCLAYCCSPNFLYA